MTANPKHYVNNRELYEEMVKHRSKIDASVEKGVDLPRASNYIGRAIMAICTNLARRPNFSGYSYKDEMISDAIENCVAAVNNFDPTKSKYPFAYFTRVAWNAFIRRIGKEKRETYIKHKNFEHTNMLMNLQLEGMTIEHGTNEFSAEVIRSFEEKLVNKPKKKEPVGLEIFVEDTADA